VWLRQCSGVWPCDVVRGHVLWCVAAAMQWCVAMCCGACGVYSYIM